jgi:hypothetical protein
MAFLANEANYQFLRNLHKKNLIVPVVGDFAGSKAIRSVGEYLKKHDATVTAFYLSNVEQYLYRGFDDALHFYKNVETLPLDSTSTFIRSVPPSSGFGSMFNIMTTQGPFSAAMMSNNYSVQVIDSGGVHIIVTTSDSAGKPVTTRTIDTSATRPSPLKIFQDLRARDDSLARLRADSTQRANGIIGPSTGVVVTGPGRATMVANAGTLVSGLASIRETLDAFNSGRLPRYSDVTAMTKIDGWK